MKISNQTFENNGVNGTGKPYEGPFPGRYLWQVFSGLHPATVIVKWNKEMNKVVMEFFHRSKSFNEEEKPIRGYKKGMFKE